MGADLLIPEGGILLHIGPYKTGSTAIQMALADRRDDLGGYGVRYPGDSHRQARPGWALLGRTPRARRTATIDEWEALADECRAHPDERICISTEDFGTAGPDQVRRILDDLGPERVTVMAVARRLDTLLPSQWQERIKTCHDTEDYDEWLRYILQGSPEDAPYRKFWGPHDVGRMLSRWVPPLPPEQFRLVISDDTDRELLPRTFESMLGLPTGFLVPASGRNSSLSLEKVELIRRVNASFEANQWADQHHLALVHRGILPALRDLPRRPDDPPIPKLPPWAWERVAELSEERVRAVEASGVRLVGDPESLRPRPDTQAESSSATDLASETVSLETAVAVVEGVIRGALARERQRDRASARKLRQRQHAAAVTVGDAPGRELVREIARRAARRSRRALAPSRGPQPHQK